MFHIITMVSNKMTVLVFIQLSDGMLSLYQTGSLKNIKLEICEISKFYGMHTLMTTTLLQFIGYLSTYLDNLTK